MSLSSHTHTLCYCLNHQEAAEATRVEEEEGDTKEEAEAVATKEEGAGADTKYILFLQIEELDLYLSSSFRFALGVC